MNLTAIVNSSVAGSSKMEPLTNESFTLILVLCVGTLCVGSVGNIMVIALFTKYKSLRTVPNLFVINLTVADLSMCLLCIPVVIVNCSKVYLSQQLEHVLCNFEAFTSALMGFVSIVTLTALAVDRCYAISFSLHFGHRLDRKMSYLVIASIWLLATIGALLPFIGLGKYVKDPYKVFCTFDSFSYTNNNVIYNILINIVFFAIPLLTVITSYAKIYVTIRRHETQFINMNSETVVHEGSMLRVNRSGIYERQDIKSAKAAFKLVCVFLLSWLPYSVVSMVCLYGNLERIPPIYVTAPGVAAKMATILNPLLYTPIRQNGWSKVFLLCTRKCQSKKPKDLTSSSELRTRSFIGRKKRRSSYYSFQIITSV